MKKFGVPLVDDPEAFTILCKSLEVRLGLLSSGKKFYQGKRLTVEEFASLAKEVFRDVLGTVRRRAAVREKV